MAEILAAIHREKAECLLMAERAFLKTIGGSCNAPAAALCREENGEFSMRAMYVKDGIHSRKTYMTVNIEDAIAEKDADSKPIAGTAVAAAVSVEEAVKTDKEITEKDTARKSKVEIAAELGISVAHEVNKGMVYLVGAGPGDEDLMTRKGLKLLREADVVVYDNLASSSLLNEVRDDAELIYAGKRSSNHHLKQYETNELLVKLALEGKNVVRLKGGDPYIFGRGGEEGQELREAGVDFEVVPGISSSYSVPAYCGIPVTHRDFASSFHVITGHEGNHKNGVSVLNYETLAKEEGTLIFLMGLKNLPNIVASLIENGKDPATPVGVLQEGTTARQRVATGTLADIVEVVKREGIKTPAITVVGDVVSLRQVLDWYGHKPLSGKSVLVTGTTSMVDRLSPILKEEGAEAISFSLIRTERMKLPELDVALKEIDKYNWIVFTSANGVECFFEEMQEIRKPAITPDFEGSGKIFPEQEEEPEGTRVLKRTDPKARIHGEYSSKNRKSTKRKKKFEPLFAAAVIMVIAVCIVVSVFIWLLKENAELQKLKQSVTETVQSAENKQLQETLEKIQSQATEISDNLNDYSLIGSEDEGKICYLRQKDDGSWQVMKILIYPSLSQDGYYQEYYYWNNELFFAYIWADNNTMSDLKDGEQKID